MTTSTIFIEHIASDVTFQFTNHLQRVADQLGVAVSPYDPLLERIDDLHSQIRGEIEILARFASGRTDTSPQQVERIIDTLLTLLFSSPSGTLPIADTFWTTPLGQLILHCRKRLHEKDWITHKEAAAIIFGSADQQNLVRLRRLIDTGALTRFIDPDIPNQTHAGRVLRSEALEQAAKYREQTPRQ